MYKKVLTPECPSCADVCIDDDNNFVCGWGNAKKKKILLPHKGKKPKFCKLMKGK